METLVLLKLQVHVFTTTGDVSQSVSGAVSQSWNTKGRTRCTSSAVRDRSRVLNCFYVLLLTSLLCQPRPRSRPLLSTGS